MAAFVFGRRLLRDHRITVGVPYSPPLFIVLVKDVFRDMRPTTPEKARNAQKGSPHGSLIKQFIAVWLAA